MNTVIPILLIKLVYLEINMKVFVNHCLTGKNFEWNGKEVGTNTVVDNGFYTYQFDRAVSLPFNVIFLTLGFR